MCYCGCSYENRNGGGGKPFNKICPQIADEIKDKEEKMNVKEFKSEKQLRFLIEGYGLSDMQKNSIVSAFKEAGLIRKEAGLIRKSELHQKVKEAEEMIDMYQNAGSREFKAKYNNFIFGQILIDAFIALKQSHPWL